MSAFILSRNPHRARGVSLVELMVAIVISSILVIGMVQIFALNKRTHDVQDDSSRMQESGRFAFNMIMQDLRRAGYYGGNANVIDITGTHGLVLPTDTCPNDNSWARMLMRRISGLNDTNAGYACIPAVNYLRGDVLVVRYTRGIDVAVFDPNRLYVRSSMFEGRMFTGNQENATANQIAEFPQKTQELMAHAYYVGPSNRNCPLPDEGGNAIPIPALFRTILNNNAAPQAEEVASSIEHLQFQYGVDTTDDFSVNQYLNANEIIDWAQVIAVRFWVLARAECPSAGYTNNNTYTLGDEVYIPNDNFRRQLYSSTVALRN